MDIDIEKLATLARIELTAEEKKRFAEQLASVLEHFEEIKEVDVSSVDQMPHPSSERNKARADVFTASDDAREAVEQFPDAFGNLNKVKPVLGEDSHGH